MEAYATFTATIGLLSQAAGGRSRAVSSGYRPCLRFRAATVIGAVTLPVRTDSLGPGGTATVTVNLIKPVARETRTGFETRDDTRAVGTGTVGTVIEQPGSAAGGTSGRRAAAFAPAGAAVAGQGTS
ncbi:hypothetical protein [Streptomyces sp. NPDC058157]|uniref:EF-Tu C-terminal domain-related protein n=1 Tax=Streptomyces sp. NPDC058157 TaxID=3346360 RepID=UPI0036E5AF10